MLAIKGLGKFFGNTRNAKSIFRQLDLVLNGGDAAAIFGANGVGKSTFLRCVAGLLLADEGEIELSDERRDCSLSIAYLFDGPKTLRPRLTAHENLRYFKSVLGLTDTKYLDRAHAILKRLNLQEIDKPLQFLSRGSQQKVNIAMGLAARPSLIVCDEPSSFLDSAAAAELASLLKEAASEKAHVLMATHNLSFATGVGAKLLMLTSDGLGPFDKNGLSSVMYSIEFHDVDSCIQFANESSGNVQNYDPRKVTIGAEDSIAILPYLKGGKIKEISLI